MTSLTQFTLFSKLPPELRLQIWRDATSYHLFLDTRFSYRPDDAFRISLRRDKSLFINACRESRSASVFDATRDVLCLSDQDLHFLFLPGSAHPHIYDEVFGVSVVPLLQHIRMPKDVVIGCGRFRFRDQFSKDLIRLSTIFPGLKEITVGTLRSTRKSKSKRSGFIPADVYAIMREPTLKRFKALVDDALAAEETLRIGWKAPVIIFEQLKR